MTSNLQLTLHLTDKTILRSRLQYKKLKRTTRDAETLTIHFTAAITLFHYSGSNRENNREQKEVKYQIVLNVYLQKGKTTPYGLNSRLNAER